MAFTFKPEIVLMRFTVFTILFPTAGTTKCMTKNDSRRCQMHLTQNNTTELFFSNMEMLCSLISLMATEKCQICGHSQVPVFYPSHFSKVRFFLGVTCFHLDMLLWNSKFKTIRVDEFRDGIGAYHFHQMACFTHFSVRLWGMIKATVSLYFIW